MDPADFTSAKPGRLELINGRTPDTRFAFVPNALPPAWDWPSSLWPLLLEARTSLARLDGVGKHLPDPGLILQPLQAREAQLSSRLEGTVTDPQQQVLFEIEPTFPSEPHAADSFREVHNYRRALEFSITNPQGLPLSLRLIRQFHAILMEGVRGDDQRPGEFRTIQNQIGRPARFVPPPPESVPNLLHDLEAFLHAASPLDPLVKAFLVHYQFEAIHPFRDGNGRVGRLLMSLCIAEWCNLSKPWLYMSPYFERHKDRYLDLLQSISTRGDWEAWVHFCLTGVIHQAVDTERRCDRLLSLHREFHDRLKDGSVRLSRFVDLLFSRPATTVSNYCSQFAVTYPTARKDLARLEQVGIVRPMVGRSPISYYCEPIFSITYNDFEADEP